MRVFRSFAFYSGPSLHTVDIVAKGGQVKLLGCRKEARLPGTSCPGIRPEKSMFVFLSFLKRNSRTNTRSPENSMGETHRYE